MLLKSLALLMSLSLSTAYAAPFKLLDEPNLQVLEEDEEYKCDFEGVKDLNLPLYPDKSNSPTFNFKYQIVGDLKPDDFVIIYLPGGPGGSSIADYSNAEERDYMISTALPANVPWIFFDPRTVGCNRGDEKKFPDDSLTSQYLASDVLGVIRNLGLKKYIIHGHSYGSQLATFVAGQALKEGASVPHALFLSGVLGRGEADGTFSIPYNLGKEWDLIRNEMSPKAIQILEEKSPLGFDTDTWSRMIQRGLYRGNYLYEGKLRNILKEELAALNSDTPSELDPLLETLKSYARGEGRGDYSHRLFNKVDCHEFSPADGGAIFSEGRMILDPEDTTCANDPYDRPYDSATLLTEAPIYYIAGENDPAAPYLGAYYHFEHQQMARRNFVKVPGGGHNKVGLIFPDCKDEIWAAVFDKKDLTDVLTNCDAEVELMIR